MRKAILHNTSDLDVNDYPVQEAQFDQNGEIMKDEEGNYKTTGKTLTWSIGAGEKVRFPAYVAEILSDRYGFLDMVEHMDSTGDVEIDEEVETKPMEKPEVPEETQEAKAKTGGVVCKYCGRSMKNMRGLGLHIAIKHPGEIT